MAKENRQKHCTQCGSLISEEDKFCGDCGAKILNEERTEKMEDEDLIVEEMDDEISTDTNSDNIKYFSVSLGKLATLSVATFGLYELYWFYKNWQAVEEQGKEKISPFWRTFFTLIFCYGLFKRVLISAQKQGYTESYSPGWLAALYIIITVMWKLPDPLWLVAFLSFIPLLTVQQAISFNNFKVDSEHKKYDSFTNAEIIIIIIGITIWLGILSAVFGDL